MVPPLDYAPASARDQRPSQPFLSPLITTTTPDMPSSTSARPSPIRHIPSPTRASFESAESSGRTARHANRISVSFPIQPSPRDSRSPPRSSQGSSHGSRPSISELIASPAGGPTDTNFLTAIATQERRVLELKEELQRAETDLIKLKRQWTMHEASKKRNDARQMTKLQPLQMASPVIGNEDDQDGSSAWMLQEMERRKAFLHSGKSSNRTVFSGSKHTRALSLLSPTASREPPATVVTPRQNPHPPRMDSLSSPSEDGQEMTPRNRSATTSEMQDGEALDASVDPLDPRINHEVLLNTGKKMASDFKDGLWTFFDDLRQATVGDDATHENVIQPPHLRAKGSKQSLRTARSKESGNDIRSSSRASTASKASTETTKRQSPTRQRAAHKPTQSGIPDLADPSFWTEFGAAIPETKPAQVKKVSSPRNTLSKSTPRPTSTTSNDAWDAWDDSPQVSRSSSATSESATVPSTVSGSGSPRNSAESLNAETPKKNEPIPWPALNKFGPATLRRTASHLMNEWEKSLTPSPGKEWNGQEDYMGFGAEAAATPSGSQA